MRFVFCKITSTMALCLLWHAPTSFAQDAQSAPTPAPTSTTPPAVPPVAAASTAKPSDYLPVCSTEKVNGECFLNIDRRYPISMPTFQMRRGAHITVYVFHPFAFESLTLDPGQAQAFQGTDQAAGLLNAVMPYGKGAIMGTVEVKLAAGRHDDFSLAMSELDTNLGKESQIDHDVKLAEKINDELKQLNALLTQALDPVSNYISETKIIYAQVREIESTVPRSANLSGSVLRGSGVPVPLTPNPWERYSEWRQFMITELNNQGAHTTNLLGRLPGPCQKSTDPQPPSGPWLAPARKCNDDKLPTQDSSTPLAIPGAYDVLHATLESDLASLPQNRPDPDTYNKLQTLKNQLDARHLRVSEAITLTLDLLPAMITKITTDMESVFTNIVMARDPIQDPIMVGVISGPGSLNRPSDEKKILAPYKALGPQIVYTLNAQNEIANSLLALPTAAQKQPIVTITSLYAAPKFEVSAGAFFSWLPNRTFANKTEVTIKGGVPTPTDVKIFMTKTVPPLVIPFAAANYRISPEYDWLGGRRKAIYATLGVGLNPYNTQVEYVGGFSFSWRYLMFSPLYHLGHGTHLTQGEEVGQIWCVYGAASGSNPPACGGSPPSPTTKTYWTGAFAIGISVRVPTTFSSSNH
jgi:hypothetical protein